MIKSFATKATEQIWYGIKVKRWPEEIQQAARRKLRMLNNSQALQDLLVPPSNRLESLQGNRKGQKSIRINDRWRICFIWKNADCFEVEIVDYH